MRKIYWWKYIDGDQIIEKEETEAEEGERIKKIRGRKWWRNSKWTHYRWVPLRKKPEATAQLSATREVHIQQWLDINKSQWWKYSHCSCWGLGVWLVGF